MQVFDDIEAYHKQGADSVCDLVAGRIPYHVVCYPGVKALRNAGMLLQVACLR